MTQQDQQLFYQGKDFWYEYVNLNGYAFRPNKEGLNRLSKNLDVNVPYLKKCINIFLDA